MYIFYTWRLFVRIGWLTASHEKLQLCLAEIFRKGYIWLSLEVIRFKW